MTAHFRAVFSGELCKMDRNTLLSDSYVHC